MANQWISREEFQRITGLPERTARYHINRAFKGTPSRAFPVMVRTVGGKRGGNASVCYEVALSSLPESYQKLLSGPCEASHTNDIVPFASVAPDQADRLTNGQYEKWQAPRFAIIEPAVRFGLSKAERADAIKAVVAAGHRGSTVRRWIKLYDQFGISGLARKAPSNRQKRRVIASRKFQKAWQAAGYPVELLPELESFVDRTIMGLWKGRASIAGENHIRELASFMLFEECERVGCPLPRTACEVSSHRVDEWRVPFETVAKKNLHAKAFADSMPRIARDWWNLPPMEVVIADVKHLDVLITREDGTTAYPKMIGFMDGGTGRLFSYLVLCPQRHGITQELVIEAFLAMAKHPHWGLPRTLYLDNGSEFGGLDKIIPALALLRGDDGNPIIRAMPYNASAKPIEPLFRRFDLFCSGSIIGYTGPNRMDKRTQNVGCAPVAYSKPWESFCEEVGMLIDYYHQRTLGGQWNASPNDVFRSKLADGWRPTFARPFALEMSFCDAVDRLLGKEGVKFNGQRYYHPELDGVPRGTTLSLLVPWWGARTPIAMLPGREPFQLQFDLPYAYNDTEGAKESARRKATYRKQVAALDRSVPTIEPVDVKRRMVSRVDPIAIPGRPRFLDQGAVVHELASAGALIEHQSANDDDLAARRKARADRITANLLREQNRGK